jgi:hypothetical protein
LLLIEEVIRERYFIEPSFGEEDPNATRLRMLGVWLQANSETQWNRASSQGEGGAAYVYRRFISGMQIYYNYVKPHDGLKGKTPAEAAGIEIKGKNKWITIIQNASKKE